MTDSEKNNKQRYGVLLVNLGTPKAPTAKAVAQYLREFLSDTRVVEIPRAIWFFILNGIILPLRSPKVARAYAGIWLKEGSPLRVITEQQKDALAAAFSEDDRQVHVDYAMTYGEPRIADKLNEMQKAGIEKIVVLPLYPQYSATTTAAVYDKVCRHLAGVRNLPEIRFVKDYYHRPDYINALASSILEYREANGSADKLMFSFHGIPKRCVNKGDPYFEHCKYTAQHTAKALGLTEHEWIMTFQSRFGKEEWLKPYTDETLEKLASQGVRSVQVVCPAFAADCLETLEEISVENAEVFEQAGGEKLSYIPALNAREDHIACLQEIVNQQLDNW